MGKREVLGPYKADGLTVVLTYMNHKLEDSVTSGNGIVGERILAQASEIINVPHFIDEPGEVIIRGEAVILSNMFEVINESLPEGAEKYKTCRNLASGTIRNLDLSVVRNRKMHLFAFEVQKSGDQEFQTDSEERAWLEKQGFDLVPYEVLHTANDIRQYVKKLGDLRESGTMLFDTDGAVFKLNDKQLCKKSGTTAKYPRYSLAFK
ncbi:DNA ligase [Lachnospiraceae bacterium KM106-2]|nr:DNA ligase [Lachnospiraceae bacterium KM106-2]